MSHSKNSTETSSAPRSSLRLVLLGLCVVALLVFARSVFYEPSEPRAALELLRPVKDRWWAVPAFLGAYLLGTSGLVPAVAFHMISGAVFGFPLALALNLLAVNFSANLQFLFARHLGREVVAVLLGKIGRGRLDGLAISHGLRAVVLLRQLPLPFVGVNAAAGVSSIKARDFALGSALGSLPVTVVYTYFAASLAEGVAGAKEQALLQSVVAGALIVLVTFVPRWWARRAGRRSGSL